MMILQPIKTNLGGGVNVQRALPVEEKDAIGPFVFWDHIGPVMHQTGEEIQVRAHPHIGLATITYLFSGTLIHRDSLGHKQAIVPGEVNWMTAGSGIAHSERSQMPDQGNQLEGIQLWVGLPKEQEEIDPSFQHYAKEAIPNIEKEGASWDVIVGSMFGQVSPVKTVSTLFYTQGKLSEGYQESLVLDARYEWGIYVVSGQISVEQQSVQNHRLITGKGNSEIKINATTDAHILFFGGPAFQEKRHKWWNFVSTSKARIEQAKQDWKNKKFGQVIDEHEWIDLPE